MVAVEDRREIRYHRARKAWPCASRAGSDCQGEIAPGDRYAEVRHAGLSDRTFGKRYCLPCAGAMPVSMNGSAATARNGSAAKADTVAERVASAKPAVTAKQAAAAKPAVAPVAASIGAEPVVESTTGDGGSRSAIERRGDGSQSVVHLVRLVALWVIAVALSVGALYATMRGLDWFLQVMQQPMRPGGTS